MTPSELVEVLLRISVVFLLGLLLSRVLRPDCAARRLLWAWCFASPLVVLLPLPPLTVPILKPPGERVSALTPMVFELDPRFAAHQVAYLPDPGPHPLVLLVAGLAGVGLLVLGWRMVATLRLVRAAEQVTDAALIDLVYELGQHYEVADAPILKASDAIRSPCVWGVTQPVILVPAAMRLDEDQWRLVLEHELLHLRQRDPLRLVWYSLVQHLFWWNPLVWLGLRQAVLANEQVVDQALASRSGYAALLGGAVVATPQPALSRLLGQGHLLGRIRTLAQGRSGTISPWRFAALAALAPVMPFQMVAPYHPDPRRIGIDEVVFVSFQDGKERLWRMATDGRAPTPLSEVFIGAGVPRISPNGRWLAYTRESQNREDIYVARVDGTEERSIVSTPARDVQPVWSPDGTRLVFCTMATGNWEVGLADLRSGAWRFVTHDGLRNLEPTWHPNGERIVFSSHRAGVQNLWSMNLDGSGLVRLTDGTWEDTHGVYSADGRFLIYSSFRRTKYEATLLDLKTGFVQPLVPLRQLDTGEVSFADGDSAVMMTSQDGTQAHIARVDLRDFRFRVLTDGAPCLWPATR
ncbi:MAG: hypothetical protein M9921_14545 [Fimbriimonadaceae bacterium]|nr:PD40 domain-containing protein [Chthonomonadaceae bacterium]MCO5298064.1 hypothetical protein [Fimbriimonadaceae bacterium]